MTVVGTVECITGDPKQATENHGRPALLVDASRQVAEIRYGSHGRPAGSAAVMSHGPAPGRTIEIHGRPVGSAAMMLRGPAPGRTTEIRHGSHIPPWKM